MSARRSLVLAIAMVIAVATPALAQGTHVKIYGGAAYISPISDDDISVGSITESIEAADQVGWNLGVEGRLGKIIGFELDYINATQDIEVGGATFGSANFAPFTLTLNFHVIPTRIVDLYFGPSYSYVNWGDLELNQQGQAFFGSSSLGTDSDHAWGAAIGLDVSFLKHFAITGGLRYLDVDLQATSGGQSVGVDPLIGRLGVAVRF